MDCLTPGAVYHTSLEPKKITVSVDLPFELAMTFDDAVRLEHELHATVEKVLAPFFENRG